MIRRVFKTVSGREVVRLYAETEEDEREIERLIEAGELPEPLDSLADWHAWHRRTKRAGKKSGGKRKAG